MDWRFWGDKSKKCPLSQAAIFVCKAGRHSVGVPPEATATVDRAQAQ
ncbi:hypothetical protein [Hymenobacter siberiensis]|nr:hypothetical protein [Hymenobacter siberiensis]